MPAYVNVVISEVIAGIVLNKKRTNSAISA